MTMRTKTDLTNRTVRFVNRNPHSPGLELIQPLEHEPYASPSHSFKLNKPPSLEAPDMLRSLILGQEGCGLIRITCCVPGLIAAIPTSN